MVYFMLWIHLIIINGQGMVDLLTRYEIVDFYEQENVRRILNQEYSPSSSGHLLKIGEEMELNVLGKQYTLILEPNLELFSNHYNHAYLLNEQEQQQQQQQELHHCFYHAKIKENL